MMSTENRIRDWAGILARRTPLFHVGTTKFPRTNLTEDSDYSCCLIGLVLYMLVLSDGASTYSSGDPRVQLGRITTLVTHGNFEDLTLVFTELEIFKQLLLEECQRSNPFKGECDLSLLLKGWRVSSDLGRLTRSCLISLSSSTRTGEALAHFVRYCLTLACFFNKMEIARPDLIQAACDSAILLEHELADLDKQDSLEAQQLLVRLHDLYMEHPIAAPSAPYYPKHGPGAVAEQRVSSHYEKYLAMTADARIDFMLKSEGLCVRDFNPYANAGCARTNRFCSVPKNWKKRRSISSEPACLQYWQQAIRRHMASFIEGDPWWSRRVKFSDQKRSRNLSRIGSLTGSYATIDLSAASDSVRLTHVRRILGNCSLMRWLLATRSTSTQFGDDVVVYPVHKFAPMGSSTCFPTETLVFTLIAELAILDSLLACDTYHEPVVYGDDIIVPYYAVETLRQYLTVLGFTLNVEKSYWSGYFREACGIWAWAGLDITPIQYKRSLDCVPDPSTYIKPEAIASTIDTVNALELAGLHSASRSLLNLLGDSSITKGTTALKGWSCLEFSDDPSCPTFGSIYTMECATNFRLKRRFVMQVRSSNGNAFQCTEYKLARPKLVANLKQQMWTREHSSDIDNISYREWLISHQRDSHSDWNGIDVDLPMDSSETLHPIGMVLTMRQRWRVACRPYDKKASTLSSINSNTPGGVRPWLELIYH